MRIQKRPEQNFVWFRLGTGPPRATSIFHGHIFLACASKQENIFLAHRNPRQYWGCPLAPLVITFALCELGPAIVSKHFVRPYFEISDIYVAIILARS